jgi:hypothetical protein
MFPWDTFKNWFENNTDQLVVARFPEAEPSVRIEADQAYIALWLEHGFLGRDADWFTRHAPVVHLSARFDVAGLSTTLTKVVQHNSPGVWLNYPLTGIVPYRGGTVEIEAGMSVIREANRAGAAIGMLAGFSSLVGPPLSTSLTIAGKLTEGIQQYLSEQDEVVLGVHDAFTPPGGSGGNILAPGHLAVVKAADDKLNRKDLSVVDGRLHRATGDGSKPLTGFDYLLFRVEALRERGDWHFPHFEDLIKRATDAHFAQNKTAFKVFRNAALAEVHKSPDLIEPDRFRIARAIRAELERISEIPVGLTAEPIGDLTEIVDRYAPSVDDPGATGAVSLEELIGDPRS